MLVHKKSSQNSFETSVSTRRSTKRSQILKQVWSFKKQVCLSMCELSLLLKNFYRTWIFLASFFNTSKRTLHVSLSGIQNIFWIFYKLVRIIFGPKFFRNIETEIKRIKTQKSSMKYFSNVKTCLRSCQTSTMDFLRK